MSGFCLEANSESEQADFSSVCFVCQLDLTALGSNAAKERHLNACLNALEAKSSDNADSTTILAVNNQGCEKESDEELIDFQSLLSDESRSHSLRAQNFVCIICDLDLSRRNVTARCHHLKR